MCIHGFMKRLEAGVWKARLRRVYDNVEELSAYNNVYNVCARLGFASPAEAWAANPMLRGSVDHRDFSVVRESVQRRKP